MRKESFSVVQKTMIILFALLFSIQAPSTLSAQGLDEYEGVYLEINKATNTLQVYLNGHVNYTFDVATGMNEDFTPLGTFKIITKVKEPWYLPKDIAGGDPSNPLGTRWIGINVPDTDGYKYGIHGTNEPSSIGQNVSQGCIRMHNNDVEWLFRHIPKGTLVIIKNNSA
jgi:lipoprotein-anchoring transpeptidase ErfK/SrfK